MTNISRLLTILFGAVLFFGCAPQYYQEEDDNMGQQRQGWSVAGELVRGNPDPKVGLQADFKLAKGADFYTVEFSVGECRTDTGGVLNTKVRATIRWKTEGNYVQRIVNVANGLTVSGTAEGVEVSIEDTTALNGFPLTSYVVSATVTPGNRPGSPFDPRLNDNGTTVAVSPGAGVASTSADIDVPIDAGVKSVLVSVTPVTWSAVPLPEVGEVRAVFTDGTSVLFAWDPTLFNQVPIPPGARKLHVSNFNTTTGFACWVNWGVDG